VSDVEGNLGNTASFSRKLSKGTHTITLTVEDGQGETDTKQITIVVKKPSEPSDGFIPFTNIPFLIIGLLILTVFLYYREKRLKKKRI